MIKRALQKLRVIGITPRTTAVTFTSAPQCTGTMATEGGTYYCTQDEGHRGRHRWFTLPRNEEVQLDAEARRDNGTASTAAAPREVKR